MSNDTAYTELETLLLFQALRAEGVSGITPTTFNRISDQLKTVPLVCEDPRYDVGRLSPDALRQLYLDLLKEEAKQELDRQANGDGSLTNGNLSPGSRKRKAPSPHLPTVREAQQHSHLIPQLISRLYRRYRGSMIHRLQHHERKYANAKQEIAEIEAGDRDESLQNADPAYQSHNLKHSGVHGQSEVAPAGGRSSLGSTSGTFQSSSQQAAASSSPVPTSQPSQTKLDAFVNQRPEPEQGRDGGPVAPTNTGLSAPSEYASQSPRSGYASQVAAQPVSSVQSGPHHGYNRPPSIGHQSPYASQPPHAHPRPPSAATSQMQQMNPRHSSSPRPILPPPQGIQASPSSSAPQVGSPAGNASGLSQQHPSYLQGPNPHYSSQPHIHLGASSLPDGSSRSYHGAPLPPQPAGYHQQSPYVDRRTTYPSQHSQQGTGYPMQPVHQGGPTGQHSSHFMQSQHSSNMPPQQHLWPQHTPVAAQRTYPYAHLQSAPSTGPRPIRSQSSHLVSDVVAALATPPRHGSKPLWKNDYPSHIAPSPKPRPEIEPLSPTLESARSPSRPTRNTRSHRKPSTGNHAEVDAASKGRASKRRTNNRDKSPHSVVSSTADESLRTYTRSQSASTAVGTHQTSDDRPGSASGIKHEPSPTADNVEEGDHAASISTTPAAGRVTRKRRGTLQSQPPPSAKRKRLESPVASGEDAEQVRPTPPPKSKTLLATRNLAKMSSAVMNDITSHKHASYFAKEVRERDAPGYADIVRQPQNLKSIRSAITAGARAIAAASSNVDSPSGATSTSASTVELDRSVDLIPPKAIINAAQLEKELMRMFANAYLFNPGEDGMALSTKEMFEDVEHKINEWRGTERDAGRDANMEEEEDAKGKRRKT